MTGFWIYNTYLLTKADVRGYEFPDRFTPKQHSWLFAFLLHAFYG